MNLNFTEIESFPLAWRWKSQSHGNFSPEQLKTIQPLSEESAELIRSKSIHCKFGQQKKYDASKSLEEVSGWLESVIPKNENAIYIFWDPKLAILTTRELFIRQWDDFCYPSSDDVEIFSPSNNFKLYYYHYEVFQFSEQKAC